MTATDELREMLDERGVSHVDNHPEITGWWGDSDIFWVATEIYDDVLDLDTNMTNFTPEQVIAATLGADECAIEHNVDGSYECPICGCVVDYDIRGDDERIITMDDYVIPFNFCPKCGAEVVYE